MMNGSDRVEVEQRRRRRRKRRRRGLQRAPYGTTKKRTDVMECVLWGIGNLNCN
jgi:hypothetical protein